MIKAENLRVGGCEHSKILKEYSSLMSSMFLSIFQMTTKRLSKEEKTPSDKIEGLPHARGIPHEVLYASHSTCACPEMRCKRRTISPE
jgi:hypothetical protein